MTEPQNGDKVKVLAEDKEYIGLVMPQEKDHLVIKLSTGYNLGIDKKQIKSITVLEKHIDKENHLREKISPNLNLPTISILHTGGTIASRVDYKTGGVSPHFEAEDMIDLFPEVKKLANIKSRVITKILSELLTLEHIEMFAKEIIDEVKRNPKIKGIILAHGTDTMTYTASALGFMLQEIKIPIIMVGAQRSTDRGGSDGSMNLSCALEFILKTDFRGVAICMHETSEDKSCLILPCYKSRKMHSSRRDAFRPINQKSIARVNFLTKDVEILVGWNKEDNKHETSEQFTPKIKLSKKVGIIKGYPSMTPKIFDAFIGFQGVVIEGSAMGHIPIMSVDDGSKNNENIKAGLQRLLDSGTLVFMTNQTIYGSVQMHVYSCGVELMKMGVSQAKMLTETAYIKLCWLFGNYWKSKEDNKKIIEMMQANLDGELFDRIEEDTFLI